jgi:hypothetical protein
MSSLLSFPSAFSAVFIIDSLAYAVAKSVEVNGESAFETKLKQRNRRAIRRNLFFMVKCFKRLFENYKNLLVNTNQNQAKIPNDSKDSCL